MVGRMFITTTTTAIHFSKFPAYILGSADLLPRDKAGKNVTALRYRHWPPGVSGTRDWILGGPLQSAREMSDGALFSKRSETWALLSCLALISLPWAASLQLCHSPCRGKTQRKRKCVIRDNRVADAPSKSHRNGTWKESSRKGGKEA